MLVSTGDHKVTGPNFKLSATGYAADGYARVKGISALVTTFGVGELSTINAIAGAYSEHVPVIHVVGCPSTLSQQNGMLLHHTLGNGDFNVFANMNSEVSCYVAKLNKPTEIADQIDQSIRKCWVRSRPVYIMLPTDMVQKKIEGARLRNPINLDEAPNHREREDYVVDVVLKYLYAAKRPVMLVDACAVRHRVLDETRALLEKANLPVFVTPMGKGAIDETHANYGGVYAGEASSPEAKENVESSDLLLSIGALKARMQWETLSKDVADVTGLLERLQHGWLFVSYVATEHHPLPQHPYCCSLLGVPWCEDEGRTPQGHRATRSKQIGHGPVASGGECRPVTSGGSIPHDNPGLALA